MAALVCLAVAGLGAMMLFNVVQDKINEHQLAEVETDIDAMRMELAAEYKAALRSDAPVRPQVDRIDRLISILQRASHSDGDHDALISRCMVKLLADIRPVLARHASVFDEVVGSGSFNLDSVQSREDCDAAIIAFMRFRTSLQQANAAVAGLGEQLDQMLLAESMEADAAHAAVQRLNDGVARNTLVQRLDIELATATIEVFTMLRDHWGDWKFGDELVNFEDPTLQTHFDQILARIDQLEQRQDAAIMKLANVEDQESASQKRH